MKRFTVNIILVFSFLMTHSFFFAQSLKIDSLLKLINNDKEDTNKVIHLNALGNKLGQTNNDTAIIITKETLRLSQKLNWRRGIANAFSNLGVYFYRKGDHAKAIDHYFKALSINEEIGNKEIIAVNLGNIGIIYKDQRDDAKAFEYFFKGLKIDEELGNKAGITKDLVNIGILYKLQADYPKALSNYLKALKFSEELGNKNYITIILSNIGSLYDKQGDLLMENGDQVGAYANYSKGLDHDFRSLKMAEELKDQRMIALSSNNIGVLLTHTKKYESAYSYIYRALALDNSDHRMSAVKFDYESLSDLYKESTKPLPDSVGGKILNMEQMRLRSLYYYKKHIAIRDTLFNEENKKQLVRKEMNYEFEKKELATKAEQDKKDALAAEELKIKEQQRNYFIAGFALVALLSLFILRGYRQKQKANIIITEQKKMVDEKQKEILDSIHYAKRIQNALITSEKYIDKNIERLTKI